MKPIVLLAALLWALPAQAGQTADEAYRACLVGNLVLGAMEASEPKSAVVMAATEKCSVERERVPADYNSGGESEGPESVEEDVIHLWDAVLAPRLSTAVYDYTLPANPF